MNGYWLATRPLYHFVAREPMSAHAESGARSGADLFRVRKKPMKSLC